MPAKFLLTEGYECPGAARKTYIRIYFNRGGRGVAETYIKS